jgi:signal transduction histidine kinase
MSSNTSYSRTEKTTLLLLLGSSILVFFLALKNFIVCVLLKTGTNCVFSWPDLFPVFVSVCFLISALYCFHKKQQPIVIVFLAFFSGCISTGLLSAILDSFYVSLFYWVLGLFAPLFILFHLAINRHPMGNFEKVILKLFGVLAGIFSVLVWLNFFYRNPFLYAFLKPAIRINLLLAVIITIVFLSWYYTHTATMLVRRRLRLILLGSLSALLPIILFTIIPQISGEFLFPSSLNFLWLLLLLISDIYIIFQHEWTFPEKWFQRFYVYYLLFTTTLFIFLLFFSLIQKLQWSYIQNTFSVYLVLVLFFIAFFFLRPLMHNIMNWFLYGNLKIRQSELRVLIQHLNEVSDREVLKDLLLNEFSTITNHKNAILYLRQNSGELIVEDALDQSMPNAVGIKLRTDSPILQEFIKLQQPVFHEIIKRRTHHFSLSEHEKALMNSPEIFLWIPLITQKNVIGLLGLGERRDGEPYSWADIHLVNPIMQPAGIAIRNILLTEKINEGKEALAFAHQQLIHVQEQEQRRITGELHDHTIQEITAVNFQIEHLKHNLQKNGKKNLQTTTPNPVRELELIQTELVSISREIRNLIRTIHPADLGELGLNAAIDSFIDSIKATNPATTPSIHFENHLILQNIPDEITNDVFRIIQEAVRNTLTHAYANSIWITLSNEESILTINIEDDGKGFLLPKQPGTLVYQNHFGIVAMINRVQNLNGTIKFNTSSGKGTKISILIPLPERVNIDE